MREYLQARVLQTLQDRGAFNSIAFMGGTALRFLYRIPRFSEDLDFSLEDPSHGFDFAHTMDAVGSLFESEGYACEAKITMRTTANKAFIRFPGLEYDMGLSPHPDQVFSVKVELDTNPPVGAGVEATMIRRFVTLRIAHHDKSSLLGGKLAALLLRDWVKGRDVYDLVWYLSDEDWPEPNEALLLDACRQAHRSDLRADTWKPALLKLMREADWGQVLSDVERFLEREQDAWMLERASALSVLEQRGWT